MFICEAAAGVQACGAEGLPPSSCDPLGGVPRDSFQAGLPSLVPTALRSGVPSTPHALCCTALWSASCWF